MKALCPGTILAAGLVVASGPALAYIGPGSGISLLGGLWGVLVAIVLAVAAILIWPIRYMFRRLRRKFGGAPASAPADPVGGERPSSRSE